jgi:endoglucanase
LNIIRAASYFASQDGTTMTRSRHLRIFSLFNALLVIAAAVVFSFSASYAFGQSASASVPAERLAHLRHGINLSSWFAQVYDPKGYTKAHFDEWVTADDMALIKSMGFDHVRLSVNPKPMFNSSQPEAIPPEYLGYLDAAVKMGLDHGLSVIIDIHPDSDFQARLNQDTAAHQFVDFWRTLAQHYSSWDPNRVFFEILNEPEMNDRYRWYGIEAKVAAAIREGAPKHTIIASGARWSDDDELVFMEPLRDPNVIYNFHFYEPHTFTHQGATWGAYYWHWLTGGVRYPSTPESAAEVAQKIPDAADRLNVIRYGYDHWDAARIEGEINQVAEWASQNHVPITCNEFGVFRRYADPQDRAHWISDVRTSLERHGMGWAMWDYSGGFGVVTKEDGKTIPDDSVLHALGLR